MVESQGQGEALQQSRERCRWLIEMVREERRKTAFWKRRCQALGGDLSTAEMEGLAEMLREEVGRLRGLQSAGENVWVPSGEAERQGR